MVTLIAIVSVVALILSWLVNYVCLRLQPGSRITVTVSGKANNLRVSNKVLFEKHFGSLSNGWTASRQDAAEYTRSLRDGMQPQQ